MDHSEHNQYPDNCRDTSISIRDDDDRDTRYDRPEYWDKSKNKNDECERDDIGECTMSDDDTDDDESEGGEECIDECDDRLSSKYDTKTIPDLSCDDSVLIIKECKITIAHSSEEYLYLSPFDNKNI